MHVVAPVPASVSVVEPGRQVAHAIMEEIEYSPGLHSVHVVAPSLARESVLDPGEQSSQDCVGSPEYCPAIHAVQVVPPGRASVSVTDPAAQSAQATVVTDEKVPASHAVQVVAPTSASVFVTDPGSQVMHELIELSRGHLRGLRARILRRVRSVLVGYRRHTARTFVHWLHFALWRSAARPPLSFDARAARLATPSTRPGYGRAVLT